MVRGPEIKKGLVEYPEAFELVLQLRPSWTWRQIFDECHRRGLPIHDQDTGFDTFRRWAQARLQKARKQLSRTAA